MQHIWQLMTVCEEFFLNLDLLGVFAPKFVDPSSTIGKLSAILAFCGGWTSYGLYLFCTSDLYWLIVPSIGARLLGGGGTLVGVYSSTVAGLNIFWLLSWELGTPRAVGIRYWLRFLKILGPLISIKFIFPQFNFKSTRAKYLRKESRRVKLSRKFKWRRNGRERSKWVSVSLFLESFFAERTYSMLTLVRPPSELIFQSGIQTHEQEIAALLADHQTTVNTTAH